MSAKNSVTEIGRLTKNVELRVGKSGKAYAFITIAVNDTYIVDGAVRESTQFIPVTIFGKMAVNASKYIGKGSLVQLTGRLQHGKWQKDGKDVYELSVVAERLTYLDSKKPVAVEDVESQEVGSYD